MKYFAGDTAVPDPEVAEPRNLELRNVQRALAAMSLTSITFGPEFLVVMRSDFDVSISGEPYHALTLLFNVNSWEFLAREDMFGRVLDDEFMLGVGHVNVRSQSVKISPPGSTHK